VPSWGAVACGVAVSAVLAAGAVWFLLRERRSSVVATAGIAAGLGPLLWDLVLRHTGGDFFTDAPIAVFPVSYEDTGSASGRRRSLRSCSALGRCARRPADASHSRRQRVDWLHFSLTSTSTDDAAGKRSTALQHIEKGGS
jgi:hypothetical protein